MPTMLCTRLFVTLQKEANDHDHEVPYHVASLQLMEAYLWKAISAQHVLYLLGGLSIVPGPTHRYAWELMPTRRSRVFYHWLP
jgi:hypothetical protein